MPPAPDSSMALHKEPAFGGQLASLRDSPRPPSRGSDPRRRRPAAGLPSLPRQAWTDPGQSGDRLQWQARAGDWCRRRHRWRDRTAAHYCRGHPRIATHRWRRLQPLIRPVNRSRHGSVRRLPDQICDVRSPRHGVASSLSVTLGSAAVTWTGMRSSTRDNSVPWCWTAVAPHRNAEASRSAGSDPSASAAR